MTTGPILIMAGGTGGHVFPGLAVATVLAERRLPVAWLGSENSFEAKLVPERGLRFYAVQVGGVRGKGVVQKLAAPWMLMRAIFQSVRIFRRIRPQAAVSFGGYAAGPGGIAAALLRVPLYVHEQNSIPGITNRVLARFARHVLCGFPNSFAQRSTRFSVVGNPVRAEITALAAPELRFKDRCGPLRVLCLGGSLGAKALNDLLPQALALIAPEHRPQVRHQTGTKMLDAAQAAYSAAGIKAGAVVPFISDMSDAYGWADVVLCRAGALTVSELCAAGVAAILVPYPHAVDDHQTTNAQFLVAAGGALIIQQRDLNATKLAALLTLHTDRTLCLKRAQAARSVAKSNAANQCVEIILSAGQTV
jgi:UDP-N-acetylglucosamine--N-acetylmuramyl-(pentapeptide) pyrophosphoryl-undecaprenol N-acetylglucosamine transferase